MIEKHFPNWDYDAVKELDGICGTLPILPSTRVQTFFQQASRVTKSDAKVVDRQVGKLFEGMMGFVGASDRKDFSASWEDGKPETSGHGIMVVQTFDKSIGVTFCLARISEDTFLTCGWIGEEKRQALKSLLSKQCGSSGKKWWAFWK